MDFKAIYKFCKDLDCCDSCCLRYLGIKNPSAFENARKFALQYQDSILASVDEDGAEQKSAKQVSANSETVSPELAKQESIDREKDCKDTGNQRLVDLNTSQPHIANYDTRKEPQNGVLIKEVNETDDDAPPMKKSKLSWSICRCCLGILQESTWSESCRMVQEVLDKKKYACETFACALSSPMAALVRERALALQLAAQFPGYQPETITALKEAWKWSFGSALAARVGKTLDSGAVSPLLVTLNMEYPDELQELELLKRVSACVFEERARAGRRFGAAWTRRCVEQALAAPGATADALRPALTAPSSPAACAAADAAHAPLYIAGRYVKLCRELPQTPWVVDGRRVMESSVQEIMFGPLADLCGVPADEAARRLKLVAAGREDVDVRCLGEGRPFAVEVSDPLREVDDAGLARAASAIGTSGRVAVRRLRTVRREDLAELKKGEETKCKTYEILCIKLGNGKRDLNGEGEAVTAEDVARINAYRNTPPDVDARVVLSQRTPVRVLHRRPLHARTRHIYDLSAALVPGHPQLLCVRVRCEAGTYVKEWAHGELRRTRPALGDALGAPADVLALDVVAVHLDWPPET